MRNVAALVLFASLAACRREDDPTPIRKPASEKAAAPKAGPALERLAGKWRSKRTGRVLRAEVVDGEKVEFVTVGDWSDVHYEEGEARFVLRPIGADRFALKEFIHLTNGALGHEPCVLRQEKDATDKPLSAELLSRRELEITLNAFSTNSTCNNLQLEQSIVQVLVRVDDDKAADE